MFSSNTSQVSSDATYIEDVFSTWLYTGNGSTQTINNGIDLAGKGGMVWIKQRNQATNHRLFDTNRGIGNSLVSNSTAANAYFAGYLNAFNVDGFGVGTANDVNESGFPLASWTFRKQPKFFDVVTFTINGASSNQQVAHNLGSTPGCIFVKASGAAGDWFVYHNATGNNNVLFLNGTQAASAETGAWSTSSTNFGIKSSALFGGGLTGKTAVAYLFAHNAGGFGLTGTDNVISCGSFTTDAGGNATVSLGYEPQFVMWKAASTTGGWNMLDNMRGFTVGGSDALLNANSSSAETSIDLGSPTATGFTAAVSGTNATYIYIAIRRGPMKTPTSGTSVFDAQFEGNVPDGQKPFTRSSTGVVDMAFRSYRPGGVWNGSQVWSRLQDSNYFNGTASTDAETSGTAGSFAFNNGWINSAATSTITSQIDWMFRRAPGFFDVVCYTGTGVARTVPHNLGAVPELMIVKLRSAAGSWAVYSSGIANSEYLVLNTTAAKTAGTTYWNSTTPTISTFSVGNALSTNDTNLTYVAYLFASCPGVSKVGSYTGTGTTKQINCGFTGGARFVLIKRTDSTGDWYVYDTARGIVAANDPRLSLNSTAAEVTTDDSIDPNSSGFIVNQVAATNINVSSATYIYLAIA